MQNIPKDVEDEILRFFKLQVKGKNIQERYILENIWKVGSSPRHPKLRLSGPFHQRGLFMGWVKVEMMQREGNT